MRPPTLTLARRHADGRTIFGACAGTVASWHDAGLATPLLLAAHEFERSLEAFPFEFGAILADHVVVSGDNPFDGLHVDPADLRRACEVQARSHLLHLREGYLETRGRGDALAVLIARSARALRRAREERRAAAGELPRRRDAAAARQSNARWTCRAGSLGEIVKLAAVTALSAEAARPLPRLPRRRRTARELRRRLDARRDDVGRRIDGGRRVLVAGAGAGRSRSRLAASQPRRVAQRAPITARFPSSPQPVNDFAHVIDAASARRSSIR